MRKISVVKSLILSFVLVLATGCGQGQGGADKEVRAITDQMFDLIIDENYDDLMDIMYPKVFDLVPRETMVTVIKSTFSGSEGFTMELPKEAPEYKMSEVFQDSEDDRSYAFAVYDLDAKMTFLDQTFDDEGKQQMKSIMAQQGTDIEFISDDTMKLTMKNSMVILIKDSTTKGKWTMLNYSADSPSFSQMIPSTVADAAKKYYKEI